jgi:hypothetical protein
VRSILLLLVGAALSLGLGLWSAWLAVRSPVPIDVVTVGAWQAWPNAGTPEVDPYSRARLARAGEVPLGSGEGLALLAQADDSGAPLTARCVYRIAGQTPPARLWTLSLETLEGRAMRNVHGLSAIASDALLRRPDGTFEIVLAPVPQPGNWVSTAEAGRFRVAVRLYDTTARLVTALTELTMPSVERERCT